MPRRRMIDPDIWKDHCIAALTRDERLFLIGSVSNADDEGRLEGHAAYLKAAIFMYDEDVSNDAVQKIKESCLQKMTKWPAKHQYRLVSYQNSDEEYLSFPNWLDQQKPSHPTKSKLPGPTPEPLGTPSGPSREDSAKGSGTSPSQSSLGQSSLGKVRLGQVSALREDFTKFKDSDLTDLTDLTDSLTAALREYAERGPLHQAGLLKQAWGQIVGQAITTKFYTALYDSLSGNPIELVAVSFAKTVKYRGGKHDAAAYFLTVLEEQSHKDFVERPPPAAERAPEARARPP